MILNRPRKVYITLLYSFTHVHFWKSNVKSMGLYLSRSPKSFANLRKLQQAASLPTLLLTVCSAQKKSPATINQFIEPAVTGSHKQQPSKLSNAKLRDVSRLPFPPPPNSRRRITKPLPSVRPQADSTQRPSSPFTPFHSLQKKSHGDQEWNWLLRI